MWRSTPARGRAVFLLLGALWLARRADASPDTLLVLRVDTTQRRVLLPVPPTALSGNPLPLIIAFHGAQGTALGLRNGTGLSDAADMRGVLVAYPDAPLGNWAEDCGCNNADRLGANDTGFVRALVDSIARIAPLDRKRIYMAGPGRSRLLGAEATFRHWLLLNRCQSSATEPFRGGGAIERRHGRGCAAGVEVTLYAVREGGHAWRASPALDTNALLLDFFLRHRLPEPGGN